MLNLYNVLLIVYAGIPFSHKGLALQLWSARQIVVAKDTTKPGLHTYCNVVFSLQCWGVKQALTSPNPSSILSTLQIGTKHMRRWV